MKKKQYRTSFLRTGLIPVLLFVVIAMLSACGKGGDPDPEPPTPNPVNFSLLSWQVANNTSQLNNSNIPVRPLLRLRFGAAINRSTVAVNVGLKEISGAPVNCTVSYEQGDSTIVLQPAQALSYLTRYRISLINQLQSTNGGRLINTPEIDILTQLDSSRKFPPISNNALLDLVQQQTFKYFWDFAHPVSGLARERSNGDINVVTSGGSGFGVMAIITGVNRNFITRAQGLARMQTIVGFLKNTAQKFHGAFPHWLHGSTGAVVPFSTKDNGADLVETSYLVMGLLCARQYFDGADAAETNLRADINTIWNGVEWNWFRQNNQNVLYWHWSPNFNWDMNLPVRGWNECLVTYVLAASSSGFGIPLSVYTNGWTNNGGSGFVNGATYYGYPLPLGPAQGGSLFFAHYSFMGINPNGLTDTYANYFTQNRNHTLINYNYCKTNPLGNFGYSDSVWGLTASDIPNGYTASSPTNDRGVIAPTAALSSFPYTPDESMKALQFFYYVLGDKIWGEYGFKDAFSLRETWFASSYLAIDQGPILVMIENYRSGLLWSLFTSCPEIKNGMKNVLGFTAPYL